MSISQDFAALFQRDLTRLHQQVLAFTEEKLLWECPPGIANCAGNLMLHLEGNLREFIGRMLGGALLTNACGNWSSARRAWRGRKSRQGF